MFSSLQLARHPLVLVPGGIALLADTVWRFSNSPVFPAASPIWWSHLTCGLLLISVAAKPLLLADLVNSHGEMRHGFFRGVPPPRNAPSLEWHPGQVLLVIGSGSYFIRLVFLGILFVTESNPWLIVPVVGSAVAAAALLALALSLQTPARGGAA